MSENGTHPERPAPSASGGLVFKKATRRNVKLKLGIQGLSGSGKTDGALALARSMFPNARIALVDTENESASLYSDEHDFDTLPMNPPYLTKKYEAAINAAVEAGYDLLILDTISHQWAGEGGILDRKDQLDLRGGSGYMNWARFTKEHERFRSKIVNAPIHIIATLRTKSEYVVEKNAKGKEAPRKVGTAPIQREGFEYEFALIFDLQLDHSASAVKDRTRLFDGKLVDLKDPAVGRALAAWLQSGEAAAEEEKMRAEQAAREEQATALLANAEAENPPPPWHGFRYQEQPIAEMPDEKLAALLKLIRTEQGQPAMGPGSLYEAIEELLEARRHGEVPV